MLKLSFHGAVRGVTGSAHLVETEMGKLLVDCGMHQGERLCSKTNHEEFDFDPAEIDAVLVTHAHFDHTGRLPLLIKRGFKGSIYTTPPTKALMHYILEDALRIMQYNAQKCGDDILYSGDDLQEMMSRVKGIGYHTEFEAAPKMHVMFHDAGHILGSAFISVKTPEKKIVFSGDLGNDDVPILPDTEYIEQADFIVCESTYGDKDHNPSSERKEQLLQDVMKITGRGGTVIIPAFSIERTQELLYLLDELVDEGSLPDIPVFLDSPLAIHATEVYEKYKNYLRFDRSTNESKDGDFFSFRNLHITLRVEDSKNINQHKGPKVIIAGSGMMTGGRVLHHLKRYLPDPDSGVIIIGYQAQHTLGRKIQDGAHQVVIHRETVPVHAEIFEIESFSAHAGRSKLAKWVQPRSGPAEKIFLVHGDLEVRPQLKDFMKKNGVESTIILPGFQQEFELDF